MVPNRRQGFLVVEQDRPPGPFAPRISRCHWVLAIPKAVLQAGCLQVQQSYRPATFDHAGRLCPGCRRRFVIYAAKPLLAALTLAVAAAASHADSTPPQRRPLEPNNVPQHLPQLLTQPSAADLLLPPGPLTPEPNTTVPDAALLSADPSPADLLLPLAEPLQPAPALTETELLIEAAAPLLPRRPPTQPAATDRPFSPESQASAAYGAGSPVHLVPQGIFISRRQPDGNDVFVCTGGIYAYRTIPPGDIADEQSLLELSARSAVVFYSQKELLDSPAPQRRVVSGIYLEGDVVLQAHYHTITAERLYYDFTHDHALVIDPVLRSQLPGRNLPLHLRAASLRQFSLDHFAAEQLKLSNDEFYRPNVWLGAERAELALTRDVENKTLRFAYDLQNVTANLGDLPFWWWPHAAGSTQKTPLPIERIHTSYDSQYGLSFETEWSLAWLLGLAEPPGVDSTLRLDEFSRRGPAAGIDIDYIDREYFGSLAAYIVHDEGRDDLGDLAARDDVIPPRPLRGRARWRHRHYLPQNWQSVFEISYLSDPDFLEAWEEKQFDTDKEQETLVYFKQQRDNWAFDFLAKWQLNDFDYTLTELPTAGFHIAGQDILETLTYYHDGYVSRLAERAGNRDVPGFSGAYEPSVLPAMLDQDAYAFAISRHELALPLHFGSLHFSPVLIGTYVLDDHRPDHSFLQGAAGFRAATQLWHIDNSVRSRFWDLDRMRHIIIPQASVFWVDSDLSGADHRDVFNFSLRQRFQTIRGAPDHRHSVDWLRWDISATLVDNDLDDTELPARFFFDRPEPQFGKTPFINADFANLSLARREQIDRNLSDHLTTDWTWLISGATAFSGGLNYNMHDGVVSRTDAGFAVQRSPRTAYYFGHRYLHDVDIFDKYNHGDNRDSNLLTAAWSYRLNRKYTFALTHQYDLGRNTDSYSQATIVRKFRHWYGAFSFGFDAARNDMSIMLSFWPQGFEKIAIGSRRFTRLTD